MTHTYEELKKMTVAELREIAAATEHEAVKGYSQLNKDHLLTVVCTALGIEAHVHHEAVGIDKQSIKVRIRELKVKRDAALAAHDRAQLKSLLCHIHSLKRQIHRAMV